MFPHPLIVQLAWHYHRGTLNFIVRTAVVSIGLVTPYPTIEMHRDYLIARMLRHINILDCDIHCRFDTRKRLSNLTLGTIGYFLPNNLQRLWCDSYD